MKRNKLKPRKYHGYVSANIETIPQIKALSLRQRMAIQAVASVLPFKVNNYVVEELIDWKDIPGDPLFQLSFPQEGMLNTSDFNRIYDLHHRGADRQEIQTAITEIRLKLNPHPAGQMELNVPYVEGQAQQGMQHKYRETLLFFPSQGQTCHTYCTYCFRWAQFVGMENLRFANNEATSLVQYVKRHPEVTDILITGGDPMIMRTPLLRRYIEPLLKVPTVRSIRIGTKSLAWWPYRFVTDPDADDLMKLFDEIQQAGKNMALMAHYSHPREMATPMAQEAVRRVRQTGTVIRCQAPLIRHVNDQASVWADMWNTQVKLGMVPYYMFVERDTGPKHYFEVPLARSVRIFRKAYNQLSGLGRTVRGPSMSSTPGKVMVDGVTHIKGQKVFVLKFIQGRNPDWANQVFFAAYDDKATWLDDLKPAFEEKFFFEDELKKIKSGHHAPLWPGMEPRPTKKTRRPVATR